MRQRFFVDNQNVARRSVQLELAEASDVPRAELEARLDDGTGMSRLWEDHARRESLGLRGSPTFVFDGGRAMLYGNFSEAVLNATVEELVKGLVAGGSEC
jgi:predicted DsbA family dithiol-disulfide isomerase